MSLFKRYMKAATDGEFFISSERSFQARMVEGKKVIEKICVSVDTTKIVRIPKIIICSILYKRR